MNRYILVLAIFIIPFALIVTSCSDEEEGGEENTCDTNNITYTNSIGAIINSNCALSGCHSAADVYIGPMSNYTETVGFASSNNGATIIGAINHAAGFEPMPYPSGTAKLSDCNIAKIEAWIAAGTPE